MKLIGMLDSPYVRRVAISLDLLGIEFEHAPLSVFSTFEEFSRINPVVKAPTLLLDDGSVLMDSTLIIDYFETLSSPGSKLLPSQPQALARALSTLGLALAACEKTVQIVYEHNLRPAEKLHQPWVERVTRQLLAACAELDKQLAAQASHGVRPDQVEVTCAVAWSFMQLMLPDVVKASDFPAINAHAARLEQTDLFKRYPIA
ncbi:glutathione S-transferase [Pseudomonas putida]|jgi:glutathione S-transferase|uniref:Glutathione S-transferase n=2 Tax=Pseudomonas putida group TaxID=136845 RepID=A0A2N1IVD2_9PSED|nr:MULTISPECIES: glutathione S-transferase [Pseudomonas]EKT4456166.1 glutathione S-transferase [Pseudomonas putida]EKT4472837.1 glutathione S-transferase [Pseudomonas putida]EKT4495772.1 glutathione S-transferase [Pseudomonas putida]EKT4513186.1 glutathione S-transferase [Pseudomonas putida]EKT4528568.1 glutathione S-transferase [Pseudomonas putida]